MAIGTSATSTSYLADNVIPAVNKVGAISVADGLVITDDTNPNRVAVHQASGGFNSVVEIAGKYCQRLFGAQVNPRNILVRFSHEDLQAFIDEQDTPFDTEFLNELQVTTNPSLKYAVGLTLTLAGLEFKAPSKVCVQYRGEVDLLHEVRDVDVPTDLLDRLRVVAAEELTGDISESGTSEPPPDPDPLSGAFSIDLVNEKVLGMFDDVVPEPEKQLSLVHRIGTIDLTLCCDYVSEPDSFLRRVDVWAELKTAEFDLEVPEGDVKRFYDRFLADTAESLENSIIELAQVHLTPTISLAGRNPSNVGVTEISEFDVSVFHVGAKPRQAMAAAFDLKPGCNGIVEEVEHFLGDRDYGVISDEYLVERVFKHKWRLGGFDRQLRIDRTIKVERDGNVEDATLEGVLRLDSLDYVSIDTDADTRSDYIHVGGSATGIPQRIRLGDGTIVGPDQVDFGAPQGAPWGVFTALSVKLDLSSDPEIAQFQLRAHLDAYRHVARPFARFPRTLKIWYTRTEGVTKHIFVLGDLPRAFV
jgi:hypothetical protein